MMTRHVWCAAIAVLMLAPWPRPTSAALWTKAEKMDIGADFNIGGKANSKTTTGALKFETEWAVRWDPATGGRLCFGLTTSLHYSHSKIELGDKETKVDTYRFSFAKITLKGIGNKSLEGQPNLFLTLGGELSGLREKTAGAVTKETTIGNPAVAAGIEFPVSRRVKVTVAYSHNLRSGSDRIYGLTTGATFAIRKKPKEEGKQ